MSRTNHVSLYAALQTKELILTNAEFYELKKKLVQYEKERAAA